jgi:hypothetical protein
MLSEEEQKQSNETNASESIKTLVANEGYEWRARHLVFGFFIGVVASIMLLLFSPVEKESGVMLVVFNFLFVFLVFPLEGGLSRKVLLLVVGNVVGFLWISFFSFLANVMTKHLGFFNTLYMIINPFLNLLWIVSYWSISLTVLSASKQAEQLVIKT